VVIPSHEVTIKQLTKHYNVLRQITSDLVIFPRITKIFMLPNTSAAQLQSVLAGNRQLAALNSYSDCSYGHIKQFEIKISC
jgi:hypothetical protein